METENIELLITDKKKYYTPAAKKAIDKYRSKNIDRYNELQRNYYHNSKEDEEWRQKFNERCKENNRKYRLKKKETLGETKPRGRPRKSLPIIIIKDIFTL